MSRPLAEFDGPALYLDTMVLFTYLRGNDPLLQDFFARIRIGSFSAYTSVLTFDELTYRLVLALIREQYGGSPLTHLRNDEAKLVTEFYPPLAPGLARLRAYPNLHLVDVTVDDLEFMDDAIHRYRLLPRDALHLSAMRKCDFNLFSTDSDFDRVPFVQRYTLTS